MIVLSSDLKEVNSAVEERRLRWHAVNRIQREMSLMRVARYETSGSLYAEVYRGTPETLAEMASTIGLSMAILGKGHHE